MNDQKWEQFFNLVTDIVNIPKIWSIKRDMVREKAKELDAENNFGEFLSWFED